MKVVEIKEFSPEAFEAVQKYTRILTDDTFILGEDYFRQIIESDNSHLFLAFSGDDITGMLTLAVYKSPTGTKAWIEDVVVNNNYRGQGIGRRIVLHAIDFAKTSGADILMLTSNPARIAANKLYQTLGFEQKETNVYKVTFEKNLV